MRKPEATLLALLARAIVDQARRKLAAENEKAHRLNSGPQGVPDGESIGATICH